LTTAERLLAYVVGLACEIGDRNVSRPGALEAAAEYIRGHRSSFGYRVNRQEYQVKDVTCANLGRAPRRLARLECGQATEPQPPEMAGDGAPRQAKPRMRSEGIAADSGPWIASRAAQRPSSDLLLVEVFVSRITAAEINRQKHAKYICIRSSIDIAFEGITRTNGPLLTGDAQILAQIVGGSQLDQADPGGVLA
jgi:hypothetical protein